MMRQNKDRFWPAVPFAAGVLFGTAPLCLPALPAQAQNAAPPIAGPDLPGEGLPIGLVEITGQKKTSAEIVRLAVNSAGIKEGQIFRNENRPKARQAVLEKGYYSEVYFRTEVTGEKKVSVRVEIFENPVISEVVIRGNSSKTVPTEKILPLLDSKSGDVVNINTVREDAIKIQRIYRNLGYTVFLSELEDVFDAKTNVLTFPVTETVVDSIEIEGLKKTRPYVALREMRTKVGDPLNINVLQRDIQRIFNTGLFGNVETPRVEPLEEGRVKIVIPVQEQRTGQIQVGFGYSQRQRLTGTLEVAENNFRGRGQSVSASWTVSGAVAKNQYDLGFTEPWVDKNNTSLSVNLYDRLNFRFNSSLSNAVSNGSSDKQYYEEQRGGSLSLGRPVSEFTRIFSSVRLENIRANPDVKPDWARLTNTEIQDIRGSLVQDGNIAAISFRSVTNTRDNEQDPAAGFYFSPSIELGQSKFKTQRPSLNPAYINPTTTPNEPRVLTEDLERRGPFTKLNIDVRRYIRLDKTPRQNIKDAKRTLALRLQLGTANGNIGFSEQYFVGGADTLRGYNDDRFWGNNIFLSSAELRLPIDKGGTVHGVLFTDIGSAWGSSSANRGNVPGYSQFGNFTPKFGFGFGVRVKTPVGPVRLDYGIGETKRTHFSIGQAF